MSWITHSQLISRVISRETATCYRRFMVRPRWHDALIVSAIVVLLAAGVWSLWWDDVRSILHLDPGSPGAEDAPAPLAQGRT